TAPRPIAARRRPKRPSLAMRASSAVIDDPQWARPLNARSTSPREAGRGGGRPYTGPVIAPSQIVAPSILAADFARLADEARAVEGVADWLHIDVMDNHFVPNLTIGLPVVQCLRKATSLPFDCHLMIDTPERWALGYAEVGAVNVSFHVEAAEDPAALARALRSAGTKAGLAKIGRAA